MELEELKLFWNKIAKVNIKFDKFQKIWYNNIKKINRRKGGFLVCLIVNIVRF